MLRPAADAHSSSPVDVVSHRDVVISSVHPRHHNVWIPVQLTEKTRQKKKRGADGKCSLTALWNCLHDDVTSYLLSQLSVDRLQVLAVWTGRGVKLDQNVLIGIIDDGVKRLSNNHLKPSRGQRSEANQC